MPCSSFPCLLILCSYACLLSSLLSLSLAGKPHALLLPVKKDQSTLQYVTRIRSRTPLTDLDLVVDLGGRYLWVDCESKYVSSSFRPVQCNTPQCSLIKTPFGCGQCFSLPGPGCSNQSCSVAPESPTVSTVGELGQDVFAFQSTDGSKPGLLVTSPNLIFSCAPNSLLKGLARGAKGMTAFGRSRIGLPMQLAVEFLLHPTFALCLPASSKDGVIFIGDGPYKFLDPNNKRNSVDHSLGLSYTPLLVNPVSTGGISVSGERSSEYFIGVKSIAVDGKALPLNPALLSISRDGVGGTKISTTTPHMTLETSIYKALLKAFAAALGKSVVPSKPVAPFKLCYNPDIIPAFPSIDLVLQNNVTWSITGPSSMVSVKVGVVSCLGIMDGGANPRTSVVIGGHQLEDTLLQFDLKNQRVGFKDAACGFFNFKG